MSELKTMAGGDPAIGCVDIAKQLRAEALLVCGHDPHYTGEILPKPERERLGFEHTQSIEATLGRILLRYLNAKSMLN